MAVWETSHEQLWMVVDIYWVSLIWEQLWHFYAIAPCEHCGSDCTGSQSVCSFATMGIVAPSVAHQADLSRKLRRESATFVHAVLVHGEEEVCKEWVSSPSPLIHVLATGQQAEELHKAEVHERR